MAKIKKCGICGREKEVYGYKEVDYEEVEDVPKEDLLIEGHHYLNDNDVVGVPICEECFNET